MSQGSKGPFKSPPEHQTVNAVRNCCNDVRPDLELLYILIFFLQMKCTDHVRQVKEGGSVQLPPCEQFCLHSYNTSLAK